MPRIQPIDPSSANDTVQEVFATIEKRFGMLPNFFLTAGTSPALSDAHLKMMLALDNGNLPPGLREQIAIGTAQFNGCRYCLPAHTMVGMSLGGLSVEKAGLARRFMSPDPKETAALGLAKAILETRGGVSDADLAAARKAGWSDAEIGDILGEVAINVLRNYFNRLAETDLDPFFAPIEPSGLDEDVPLITDSGR